MRPRKRVLLALGCAKVELLLRAGARSLTLQIRALRLRPLRIILLLHAFTLRVAALLTVAL